jgi:hypothetical protein
MRNLDKFTSLIKHNGIAHKHNFSTTFTMPKCLDSKYSINDIESICTLTTTSPLKGTTIMSMQKRTGTPIAFELPYEKASSTFDISFLLINDYKTFNFFADWMGYIFNSSTGTWGIKENYQSEIEVINEDKSGNPKFKMIHYECWPKELSSVELDTNDSSTPIILTVTFVCTYSKRKPI